MPTWHVYWACPATVLAGCALVGGLFVVLRLEHCREHLRLSACAAVLQGERVMVCMEFRASSSSEKKSVPGMPEKCPYNAIPALDFYRGP